MEIEKKNNVVQLKASAQLAKKFQKNHLIHFVQKNVLN
jgi:hypothetical protein